MRLVLVGDGDSPHLLKWARALAAQRDVELHAASSRGFMPGFDACLPRERRLALGTRPRAHGGNAGLLLQLPRLAAWLRAVAPDWLHAHYLSSHGTLAWLAQTRLRVPGRLAASAWGSDVLVTPQRHAAARWLLARVLRAAAVCTSDSQHMAARMRELGAREVMVFPFGLETLPDPPRPGEKDEWLCFANRALEPLYRPLAVVDAFAAIAQRWPQARLVIANDGSLREAVRAALRARGLESRASMPGRLDAATQAGHYRRARWYLSLPASDSVSVSLIEAMAQGCIPIVSALPANRELVRHGDNGLVTRPDDPHRWLDELDALRPRAEAIAQANRAWVGEHAMFAPAVEAFVARLRAVPPRQP